MVDLGRRYHGIGLVRRQRPVGVEDSLLAGQIAEMGEIARDVDRAHPGRGPRGCDIIDPEFRMSVWAAQETARSSAPSTASEA